MFRKRQGRLLPLAVVTLISMPAVMADEPELKLPATALPATSQPVTDVRAPESGTAGVAEPNFRLLRIAENLEQMVASGVIPAQFEEEDLFGAPSEAVGQQGLQPIDAGPSGGLESFDAGEFSEEFGFGDWSLISRPALSTDTSSLVDSASFIEDLEQVQGTSEVGLSEAPAVDIVTAQQFNLTTTPDIAETLVANPTTQTIRARQRSQVGFDPRIRGFYTGQVYTGHDGSYQFPVRSDLDGVFSKIDQSLIGNMQVYSGPYTVRYGSGFSFLNVDTIPAPRYQCGWENHVRLGTNVRTNGGQTYNTMTLFGGGESLGYFANVGYRKGSDYAAGDGLLVPSSYDAFNLFTGIGYDIDRQTRSELRYTHIDQDNTEYAGQFFDVDDLKSDGLTHSLVHRDDRAGFGYRIDSWANYTTFNGDTANGSKRRVDFPVLQRVDDALAEIGRPINTGPSPTPVVAAPGQEFFGTVDGDLISAGMRAGFTQELDRDRTVGAGVDFRYVRQEIDESFDLSDFTDNIGNPLDNFNTGLPAAEVFEPGLYTEYSFRPRPFLSTAVGARVSLAYTEADERDVALDRSNFRDPFTNEINQDLDVSDVLSAFFITNDIDLAPAWKARIGFGYAERLPNLEQRYSDGLFLAIIQSGFSRVIGNPTLSKERNWQVDGRINMEHDYLRARLSAFHSWIVDYITYEANVGDDPQGARLLRAMNTEYATLTGFEYYCEADLVDGWQVFGSLAYLDGRDREIDQPLAGINPLEGRAGLRLIDTSPRNAWGVEWGLRMVDNQDRLATLREVAPATGVVELETATPGFTTSYIRGYFRPAGNVNITMGAENLFDNNYYEHLNLRLPPEGRFGQTAVLSPGLTPYFGVEVDY
ncbi:TonB-dependent receptor plug domain-containing protein [Rhodopirellula sp. JC639]|uniref:TonB-dependent receptor plug domain-containing protein n=1 Tax=Stieleria mannarensis TaxID=2755585 RepID=UPI001600B6D1|nr:TonB-dependent receptor [Rhodopirellula sp. JC639]